MISRIDGHLVWHEVLLKADFNVGLQATIRSQIGSQIESKDSKILNFKVVPS